jgi:hypothetical protein
MQLSIIITMKRSRHTDPLTIRILLEYELRNYNMRNVKRINYSQLKNCPLFTFPKMWNELSVNLRLHINPVTFHLELVNSLFEEVNE